MTTVIHLLPDGSTCFSMTSNSVHSKPIGKSFVCSFMVSCYINQQLHLFLSTTSMRGSFPYTMHFPHSTFPLLLLLTLSWMSACMYILSKTNYCYLMLVNKMVKRTSVLDFGDVNSNQAPLQANFINLSLFIGRTWLVLQILHFFGGGTGRLSCKLQYLPINVH